MKTVFVFGTTHENQKIENVDTVFAQKLAHYAELLNATILIEEWIFGNEESLVRQIAHKLSIEWCNAGTPQEMTTFAPSPLFTDSECLTERLYGPIDVQIKRETYMLDKISSAMQRHEVSIFICGIAHLHSFSEKLHLAGYKVQGTSCI